MKLASKIICFIMGAIICYIFINLFIGICKYGGISQYSQILNNEDWNICMHNLKIMKPSTWNHCFCLDKEDDNTEIKLDENIEKSGTIDSNILVDTGTTGTIESDSNESIHNPYDPDYEKEFNSFFGDSTESDDYIDLEDTGSYPDDYLFEGVGFKTGG